MTLNASNYSAAGGIFVLVALGLLAVNAKAATVPVPVPTPNHPKPGNPPPSTGIPLIPGLVVTPRTVPTTDVPAPRLPPPGLVLLPPSPGPSVVDVTPVPRVSTSAPPVLTIPETPVARQVDPAPGIVLLPPSPPVTTARDVPPVVVPVEPITVPVTRTEVPAERVGMPPTNVILLPPRQEEPIEVVTTQRTEPEETREPTVPTPVLVIKNPDAEGNVIHTHPDTGSGLILIPPVWNVGGPVTPVPDETPSAPSTTGPNAPASSGAGSGGSSGGLPQIPGLLGTIIGGLGAIVGVILDPVKDALPEGFPIVIPIGGVTVVQLPDLKKLTEPGEPSEGEIQAAKDAEFLRQAAIQEEERLAKEAADRQREIDRANAFQRQMNADDAARDALGQRLWDAGYLTQPTTFFGGSGLGEDSSQGQGGSVQIGEVVIIDDDTDVQPVRRIPQPEPTPEPEEEMANVD